MIVSLGPPAKLWYNLPAMENMITILTRFVADAVWCCAVVAALALGCAVVWKWQDLAEGLKGEPKTFRAVFVAMLVVAATLFSKVDPNGAPPNLNAPLSGPAPTLLVGSPDEPVADIAKFAAINWTTNGVDLVLHRPESLATEAVEVTLAGSTNLVTATWEPFTNVVFAAGETNVAVFVDSAQLDAHSVSNMCFFAFINSGDKDEDGLADWDERFNLKINPDDPDSDGDGMPDGWEWENGASRVLDLTEAIHRLNGDFALGGEVNCTDCAALVVSFSNLLGCGLYSSIMGVNFATRKYCAIGRGLWLPPDWGWSFSYHEVAWSGTASDSDLVYDARLRYNGNSDPAIEPGTPELPIGIVFSDGGAGMPFVYRERLTPPSLSGYESCLSIPGSKKRAPIR